MTPRLLWRTDNRRLGKAARHAIAHAEIVFVSAASALEAAIKAALGRLEIPESMEAGVAHSGFQQLDIRFSHAERAASLPPHHDDPFDRMLIAQAQEEGLKLVTHDERLEPYKVEIVWT